MPKIIITKPNITEEENKRRIERLFDIISEIVYQDDDEGVKHKAAHIILGQKGY